MDNYSTIVAYSNSFAGTHHFFMQAYKTRTAGRPGFGGFLPPQAGWILKRSFRGAARLQVAVQLGPLAAEVDQIALHALGNDLLGRAAAIDLGDGRAAPLKLLIDLKKVRELVADMGRKVIIVL